MEIIEAMVDARVRKWPAKANANNYRIKIRSSVLEHAHLIRPIVDRLDGMNAADLAERCEMEIHDSQREPFTNTTEDIA